MRKSKSVGVSESASQLTPTASRHRRMLTTIKWTEASALGAYECQMPRARRSKQRKTQKPLQEVAEISTI